MKLTSLLFSTPSPSQDILFESKQMLMKLGYPEVIASLFYEKFGKKAPLLARWYKETNAHNPEDENWWRNASHGFEKVNAAVLARLYDATKSFADGKISLEQYNEIRDRLDFASFDEKEDPSIQLSRIKGYIADEFFKELFLEDHWSETLFPASLLTSLHIPGWLMKKPVTNTKRNSFSLTKHRSKLTETAGSGLMPGTSARFLGRR